MKNFVVTISVVVSCFASLTVMAADSIAAPNNSNLPAARQEWLAAQQAYHNGVVAYNSGDFTKALEFFNIAVSKDQSNIKYIEARFNTNLMLKKDIDAASDWQTYMYLVNKDRVNKIYASMPITPEAQLSE